MTLGGLALAGGGAYYLYSAGGSPKLAEKKFEHDAASVSARLKGEIPGSEKQYKKAGEEAMEQVKSTARGINRDIKAEADRADAKFEQYRQDASRKFEELRHETGKSVNDAANKFDKTVEENAQKGKSWFSGFLGK